MIEEVFNANVKDVESHYVVRDLIEYQLKTLADSSAAFETASNYASHFNQSKPDTMPISANTTMAVCLAVRAKHFLKGGEYGLALSAVDNGVRLEPEEDAAVQLFTLGVEAAMGLGDTLIAEDFIKLLLLRGKIKTSTKYLLTLYPDSLNRDSLVAHFADMSRSEFRKAPEVEITTIEGKSIDTRGKISLLFFFSTGCQPCMDEVDNLRQLVTLLSDSTIQMVGISEESSERLSDTDLGGFEICADGDTLFTMLDITAMPHLYILDELGNIRYDHIGTPIDTDQILKLTRFLKRRSNLKDEVDYNEVHFR